MAREAGRSDMTLYHGAGGPAALAPYAGIGMPGFGAGDFGAEKSSESLWKMIDDRLRGRWKWMLLTAIPLAAAFGFLGYKSAGPIYESQAVIQVTPRLNAIMTHTPSLDLANPYQFIVTHEAFVRSERVIEGALEDPALKKLGWPKQEGFKRIKDGLNADADRTSSLIYVSFADPDATVAATVVNAVVDSYYVMFGKSGTGDISENLRILSAEIDNANRALTSLQIRRSSIVSRYSHDDLRTLQVNKLEQIDKLEQLIIETESALARAEERTQADPTEVPKPTMALLLDVHPSLKVAMDGLEVAQARFDQIESDYRPTNPTYIDAKRDLAVAQKRYDQKYNEALAEFQALGSDPLAALEGGFAAMTPARLTRELEGMAQRKVKYEEDLKQLAPDLEELNRIKVEDERIRAEIASFKDRKAEIEREETRLAFVSIAQRGTPPYEPSSDARMKRAAAGTMFGLASVFGAFFLLGTLDRRAFGARQLQAHAGSNIPNCLGVLPDLGKSLSDPESSDIASHCVHQIRNQIEAVRDPRTGYVLAISSPFQGDGKTSIVMALGWSYAAAGYKTLVIDCDLVGRNLTRQLGLMGREGLKEALISRKLNGEVAQMPMEHLSALPVGMHARFGPETIRRIDLERLFDEVRQQFDVILVDTGPLLGSLESTPVTAAADGVVLSVRRGRSRTRLEECVSRLGMVGARCVGVILNCAVRSDCNRYVSDASLAAAEDHRAAHPAGGRQEGPIRVPGAPGERNALVRAMENAVRSRADS